jgi:hypothetical protein
VFLDILSNQCTKLSHIHNKISENIQRPHFSDPVSPSPGRTCHYCTTWPLKMGTDRLPRNDGTELPLCAA